MQNKAAILNFPLKDGKTPAVSKFSALLHECVWLYMRNWSHHIKVRHPEMTLTLIAKILSDPDSVFKPSKSSKEFYYQKNRRRRRIPGYHQSRQSLRQIHRYGVSADLPKGNRPPRSLLQLCTG